MVWAVFILRSFQLATDPTLACHSALVCSCVQSAREMRPWRIAITVFDIDTLDVISVSVLVLIYFKCSDIVIFIGENKEKAEENNKLYKLIEEIENIFQCFVCPSDALMQNLIHLGMLSIVFWKRCSLSISYSFNRSRQLHLSFRIFPGNSPFHIIRNVLDRDFLKARIK